jgi:hypothetical protein
MERASVTVCYEDSTFYMIAYGTTNKAFNIYTSSDGNVWENKGIVFDDTTNLPSNYLKIDAPYLFKDDTKYRLYFQVKSEDGARYDIYTAESTAASLASIVNTEATNDFTLANNNEPVLSPDTDTNEWDGKFVMHPMVVKDGDTYYMWYSAHNRSQPQQIGFASSADGYTWVKSPGNPILPRATYSAVGEPSVIKDGDTWRMWYLATDGIRYLTASGPFEFSSIQVAHADIASGQSDTLDVGDNSLVVNNIGSGPASFNAVVETGAPSQGYIGMGPDNKGIAKTIVITTDADNGDFIMTIKLHYTDAELAAADINEENMALYYYNTAASKWELAVLGNIGGTTHFQLGAAAEPVLANLGKYGVDTASNIVWAVVNHCTDFGAGSLPVATVTTTTTGTIIIPGGTVTITSTQTLPQQTITQTLPQQTITQTLPQQTITHILPGTVETVTLPVTVTQPGAGTTETKTAFQTTAVTTTLQQSATTATSTTTTTQTITEEITDWTITIVIAIIALLVGALVVAIIARRV